MKATWTGVNPPQTLSLSWVLFHELMAQDLKQACDFFFRPPFCSLIGVWIEEEQNFFFCVSDVKNHQKGHTSHIQEVGWKLSGLQWSYVYILKYSIPRVCFGLDLAIWKVSVMGLMVFFTNVRSCKELTDMACAQKDMIIEKQC